MTAVPAVQAGLSRARRYSLFGFVYLAQGAILSYFTALNALYLLSFDLSMSQVGIFSAIALTPFVLKIFLGMLSDRVNLLGRGYRVPYIAIGLVVQAAGLIAVPFIHPGRQFGLFAGLAFLLMSGMALYDTCTDGLALDTTAEEEQGTVQGIMVGARALGVVLVSAAIGVLAQLASWQAAFWALALVTIVPLPLVLTLREPPQSAERRFQWRAFRAFGNRHVIALGLLGALYSLIINGASQILNPFLQQTFGVSYITAGFYTAVWGIGVIVGGVTGGRVTDRTSHRRSMVAALMIASGAIALLAAISGSAAAWPLAALFGFAFGFYEASYFASAMAFTDPRIAASMFALLMAVANLGTGIGLAVSGALVDLVGYRETFLILAALNIAALALINLAFGRKGEVT
jgi:PAT family beta-lactamase induction signal transducer AmpG